MRKMILAVLILVLVMPAVAAQGSRTGDPIDGNDGTVVVNDTMGMSSIYCTDYEGDGLNPVQAWLCEIAVAIDGWWDNPW